MLLVVFGLEYPLLQGILQATSLLQSASSDITVLDYIPTGRNELLDKLVQNYQLYSNQYRLSLVFTGGDFSKDQFESFNMLNCSRLRYSYNERPLTQYFSFIQTLVDSLHNNEFIKSTSGFWLTSYRRWANEECPSSGSKLKEFFHDAGSGWQPLVGFEGDRLIYSEIIINTALKKPIQNVFPLNLDTSSVQSLNLDITNAASSVPPTQFFTVGEPLAWMEFLQHMPYIITLSCICFTLLASIGSSLAFASPPSAPSSLSSSPSSVKRQVWRARMAALLVTFTLSMSSFAVAMMTQLLVFGNITEVETVVSLLSGCIIIPIFLFNRLQLHENKVYCTLCNPWLTSSSEISSHIDCRTVGDGDVDTYSMSGAIPRLSPESCSSVNAYCIICTDWKVSWRVVIYFTLTVSSVVDQKLYSMLLDASVSCTEPKEWSWRAEEQLPRMPIDEPATMVHNLLWQSVFQLVNKAGEQQRCLFQVALLGWTKGEQLIKKSLYLDMNWPINRASISSDTIPRH